METNRPYVYRLTHKETGQFYIGYRCANKFNADGDLGIKYFTSSDKIKAMGYDNFNSAIVAECINADRAVASSDAYDIEQELIAYVFFDPLCLNKHYRINGRNRFRNSGFKHSDKTKSLIASMAKGRKHSDDTKLKISLIQRGVKRSDEYKMAMSNSCSGHVKSDQHRQNLSISNTGKRCSDATKMILSKLNIGKTHTQEVKDKISIGNLGKIRNQSTKDKISLANKGTIHTKEFCDNMVRIRSKEFRVVSPDGAIYVGKNLKDFCAEHNLSQSSMASVCRGKQEVPYKGWTGEYI